MDVEGKSYQAKPLVLKSIEARKLPTASRQHVSESPSGTGPNKSAQLDVDQPKLPAARTASGEIEGGMAPRTDSTAVTATNDPKPNGDESDARMARIEEILGYTATPLLDKCELVAEWVKHAEAKLSVFGQIVPKPKGGRPEGGVARAARKLPVPGKTHDARRKFIERAIKIDGIWPDVKVTARAARLDDVQAALLAIANEKSLETQLAKTQELANRKLLPRGKKTTGASEPATRAETNTRASSEIIELESLSDEQKANLAALKASWTEAGNLRRSDWEKSDRSVQRWFIHEFLSIEEIAS